MEKWLVILGVWAMCATCAVLFIRGATSGGGGRRSRAEARQRANTRVPVAAADAHATALND